MSGPELEPHQHGLRIAEPDDSRSYSVKLVHRDFTAYAIMDEELDALASAHGSINQVFLGIVFGGWLGLVVNYLTGTVTKDNSTAYVLLAVILGVSSLYFLICCVLDARSARRRVTRIRKRGPPT